MLTKHKFQTIIKLASRPLKSFGEKAESKNFDVSIDKKTRS